MNEINSYYTHVKPNLERFSPDSVSTAASSRATSFFSGALMKIYGWGTLFRRVCPWFFIIFLFLVTWAEIALIAFVLLFRKKKDEALYSQAKTYLPELASQYPFGTYAVVWKSIQLVKLREWVEPFKNKTIVEAAVGEGTFSRRVFDSDFNVVALDINPISLRKASEYPHIKNAVVCDCMNPPLLASSADLLISNNFLHHVTNKKGVLENWSKAASTIIFNDCSPNWSEALPPSYLCNLVGLRSLAKKLARTVDLLGAQYLVTRPELDQIVEDVLEIEEVQSCFSSFTYFLANIPSLVFLHMGPIPPEIRKALGESTLKRWAEGATATLTGLLLDLDQTEKRGDGDILIFYKCRVRENRPQNELARSPLRCFCSPDSVISTKDGVCGTCGKVYPKMDGMLFVLPDEMKVIVDTYDSERAAAFPKEHL